MRVFREYSIEPRYAARIRDRLRQTASGRSPAAAIGPKTEPSPTLFQSTSRGVGAQGAWLETSGDSAITGARCGAASSERWRTEREYWSGGVPQLNGGPWYPMFQWSKIRS